MTSTKPNKPLVLFREDQIFIISFSLLISLANSQTANAEPVSARRLTPAEQTACLSTQSLVSVIANPDNFQGKVIAVEGFLHLKFEDSRLYICKEHADFLVTSNAIAIEVAEENVLLEPYSSYTNGQKVALPKDKKRALQYFDNRYVLIVGTYRDGGLSQVTRIQQLARAYK